MMFVVWRASAVTKSIPEWQKNFVGVEWAVSLWGSGLFVCRKDVYATENELILLQPYSAFGPNWFPSTDSAAERTAVKSESNEILVEFLSIIILMAFPRTSFAR